MSGLVKLDYQDGGDDAGVHGIQDGPMLLLQQVNDEHEQHC